MAPESNPAFRLEGIGKRYGSIVALAPLDLEIADGETVALVGPSGAGKTTLLYILSGIFAPDQGWISLYGRPMQALRSRAELASLVGVMHQHFDLVPNLAVVHNVLAGRLGSWSLARSLVSMVSPRDIDSARQALDGVGIAHRINERTSRLSGGQQQRVAIARLLVQNPRVILADEPVSALDPARAEDMVRMLVEIAREGGHTLVASLHAVQLALKHFDRIIAIRDGKVLFDRPSDQVPETDLAELYTLDDSSVDVRDASGEAFR